MSSKLALSQEIFRSHEAAFIEHYSWLIRWALQFAHGDRERAEDLVQEVFSQFAIAHTDLSAVQNVQAYLYTTLRNIHVSQVRLASRSHNEPHSIVDYSVVEAALEATDPYTVFHTQDQLRRVCRYACLRKQSSRAGSVLILRYFHGYHLSEIARVFRVSCDAVRQQLALARSEARLFLEDPRALKFIQQSAPAGSSATSAVCPTDRLLVELRAAIFDSCEGACISRDFIRSLYVEELVNTADNSTLAHIVSCPVCLDEVNARLGLPLLADRHPADTLGPNNDWRDGTRGPRDPGGRGSAVPSRRRGTNDAGRISGPFLMQCRRRATELFEHYPRELCVSVNGHLLGSQSVSSEVSRLRVDVTIAEELDFVEVLSEERVRLLIMPIQPPPLGEPVQSRLVRLSEGRCLEVVFHYGHPWPMVEVVYEEPRFVPEAPLPVVDVQPAAPITVVPAKFDLFRGWKWFRSLWLRPGFVAAVVSLILIGILLTFRLDESPAITAANVLERASAAESLPLAADVALHRVVELEQRRRSDGAVSKQRIEVWRDQARHLSVRRVYDDKGQLTAGVWTQGRNVPSTTNGTPLRRVYRRGTGQRIETGAQDAHKAIRDAELWQLDPSAIVYLALVNGPQGPRVNETADAYVISYDADEARADGLLQATLTLRKSDLHAVQQALVITDGRETYDYRFVETVFDRPPLRLVGPDVFKPDAELISKAHAASGSAKRDAFPPAVAPAAATAELEVNIAYALDQFRTRFGDQLSLTKTPAGVLELSGVVDDEDTRKEILRALSLVVDNPRAIRIQIHTTAELLARKQQGSERVVLRELTAANQTIPVHAELIDYFSAHEGAGQTEQYREQLVRDFAARVIGRSRRAVAHSLELKQLSSRFSAAQVDGFTPSTRTRWTSLVRNHAEALRRELSTLDGELQRTLGLKEDGAPQAQDVQISNKATLLVAIDRLHKSVLTVDQAVRSSFAASSDVSLGEGVKSVRFGTHLAASVKLADEIRQAAVSQ